MTKTWTRTTDALTAKFEERQVLYERAARKVRFALEDYATDQSIPLGGLESRIKSVPSIWRKMCREQVDQGEVFDKILDIAGVRAITFFLSDLPRLLAFVEECDEWAMRDSPKDYVTHPAKDGYRSIHAIVDVPVLKEGQKHLVPCEIQLRTALQHGWAGASHEFLYPTEEDKPQFLLGRMFQLGEMLEGVDIAIDDLRKEID